MNRLSRTSCRELGCWRGNSSCLFELPFPLPREGGRVSATLPFFMFKLTVTWKTVFSISVLSRTLQSSKTKHRLHTLPEEMHCCETASLYPKLVEQTSTKTLHVHIHWTWQHKTSIPFTRCKNNSKLREPKQNRQVPRLFFPFGRMKSLACETITYPHNTTGTTVSNVQAGTRLVVVSLATTVVSTCLQAETGILPALH